MAVVGHRDAEAGGGTCCVAAAVVVGVGIWGRTKHKDALVLLFVARWKPDAADRADGSPRDTKNGGTDGTAGNPNARGQRVDIGTPSQVESNQQVSGPCVEMRGCDGGRRFERNLHFASYVATRN